MPYVLQTDKSVKCPMYSRQIWVLKAYVLQADMSVKCPMYSRQIWWFKIFAVFQIVAVCNMFNCVVIIVVVR